MAKHKLVRSRTDRMILGVAGGLADYLDIDPVFIRLAFVLIGLASAGKALLLYLLVALLLPEEPAAEAKAYPLADEEIVIHDAA